MSRTTDDLGQAISEIVADYEAWEGPFDRAMLPEKEAIVGIERPDDRARFLTLTVSIDYQRDARQLWEKARALWDDEPWVFDPATLASDHAQDRLEEIFRERNFRFETKDAEIWRTNGRAFYDHYGGTPLGLFEVCEYDAPTILKTVRASDAFTFLGGEKIGPLWMRLIHEDVHSLDRISEIDIPVDTHVRRLTNRILDTEYSDSEVRAFWTEFCRDHGFDPVRVDQPLWLIGNHWDDWGESYLTNRLDGSDDGSESGETSGNDSVPDRTAFENDEEWMVAVADSLGISVAALRTFREML